MDWTELRRSWDSLCFVKSDTVYLGTFVTIRGSSRLFFCDAKDNDSDGVCKSSALFSSLLVSAKRSLLAFSNSSWDMSGNRALKSTLSITLLSSSFGWTFSFLGG